MKGKICKVAIMVRDGLAQLLRALEINRRALNTQYTACPCRFSFRRASVRDKVVAGDRDDGGSSAKLGRDTARSAALCEDPTTVWCLCARGSSRPPALDVCACIAFIAAALPCPCKQRPLFTSKMGKI